MKMDDHTGPQPTTRDELLPAAQEYATTVPLDVPLDRVEWQISDRAKRRAGLIEASLGDGEMVGTATISLTWAAFEELGWEDMQDTITHELIHLWEYVNYGESGHGPRFKQKADELGVAVHCEQFTTPRYQLSCRGCGRDAGGRYVRSKMVQAPEQYHFTSCSCDANLQVYDAEKEVTWTTFDEFRDHHPDADTLVNPYRYILECADCGQRVATRQQRSKTVKHPDEYYCDGCDCDAGLCAIDTKTGDQWTTHSEMPT